MKSAVLSIAMAASLAAQDKPVTGANDQEKRISAAATVLSEIKGAEDNGIPNDILAKAKCVGIVPGLKRAGFIVGGQYGKGVLTCRVTDGAAGFQGWSAPANI